MELQRTSGRKLQKILLRLNANLKHISFPLPTLNNITLFIVLERCQLLIRTLTLQWPPVFV